MSIIDSGANANNVTNNSNANSNIINVHNTTTMTNTNGISNTILHNGSGISATIVTPVPSPHLDDQNPLSLKINELKQQQYHNLNMINNSQYENTSLPRPDTITSASTSNISNLANTSSKESSRFRIIKTDSDGKNVLDSSSKQNSPHLNGPSGDSNKTFTLNGSSATAVATFSIGSQNAATMTNLMNNLHNGTTDHSVIQRSNSVSQQSAAASNSNNYQRGRWYVADFVPTIQQQQHYQHHELEHNNNLDHSSSKNSLNIVKLPLNQTQTHFNPIESTNTLNQQQLFQSINTNLTLVQPTPTITNKNPSNTSQQSLLNTTNNDNTNNHIPQQLHQTLVSNPSNNLSPIQQQQLQQMPIGTQSMTKVPSNLSTDAHQNPIMTQKASGLVPSLIENSYNTIDVQPLHQQSQLQNTIDSNLLEKPQIYQQTHENVSSVLPVITNPINANPINTSSVTITQQSFDSLNLNVANVNTNLPTNSNQISPKDNNTAPSTIITSNNNNNNNSNSNNNNSIQSFPSNLSTLAGLTSIQSNSTLTTSMTTISSLEPTGASTGSQIPSTNDSIHEIVDNLNVDQKSSSDSGIHSRIELAMDLVKSHLTLAVKEEIVALKNQIKQLNEVCTRLEQENQILKQHATPETLLLIENRSNPTSLAPNNTNSINTSNPSNINNQNNESNAVNSTNVPLANTNQFVNSVDTRNMIPPPVNQDSMISSFTEHVLSNNGDIILTNISNNNNNNSNNGNSTNLIAQNTNESNQQ